MKFFKTILVTLIAALLIGFLGCAGFQDVVTLCFIEEDAATYAEEEITSFLPFTTLFDAKRIKRHMDQIHRLNQEEIRRLVIDDNMVYTFLNDSITIGMADAESLQNTMFDPSGPLGLLIPTILGGSLGAMLIKRPGDKSKKEVDLEQGVKV